MSIMIRIMISMYWIILIIMNIHVTNTFNKGNYCDDLVMIWHYIQHILSGFTHLLHILRESSERKQGNGSTDSTACRFLEAALDHCVALPCTALPGCRYRARTQYSVLAAFPSSLTSLLGTQKERLRSRQGPARAGNITISTHINPLYTDAGTFRECGSLRGSWDLDRLW